MKKVEIWWRDVTAHDIDSRDHDRESMVLKHSMGWLRIKPKRVIQIVSEETLDDNCMKKDGYICLVTKDAIDKISLLYSKRDLIKRAKNNKKIISWLEENLK